MKLYYFNRLVKILAIFLWILPILVIFISLIPGGLFVIFVIIIFYIFGFVISVPNWLFILILFIVLAKKLNNSSGYFYVALVSNILVTASYIIFNRMCNLDWGCRTSDAPLGSSQTWLLGIFMGNLFFSLPFAYFLSRILNFLYLKLVLKTDQVSFKHSARN